MSKRLLLLLQMTTLLSLSGCDWFKKSISSAEKSSTAKAEDESALIPNITSEEHFAKFLGGTDKVIVLKIDAPWCSACKSLHPLLVEIAKKENDLAFARLNIDQLATIAQQHNVVGIPTLLFFKDGKEIPDSRIVGPDIKDATELLTKIRAAIKHTNTRPEEDPQKPVAVVAEAQQINQ